MFALGYVVTVALCHVARRRNNLRGGCTHRRI